MTLKLSEEQCRAIQHHDGGPVEVEDSSTHRVYVLVDRDKFQLLVEERLRAELQIGFDQADSNDVDEWDVEDMLRDAHLRHTGPS